MTYDKNSCSLVIIDQHAAHERIRYEYFCLKLYNQLFKTQAQSKTFDISSINLSKKNS